MGLNQITFLRLKALRAEWRFTAKGVTWREIEGKTELKLDNSTQKYICEVFRRDASGLHLLARGEGKTENDALLGALDRAERKSRHVLTPAQAADAREGRFDPRLVAIGAYDERLLAANGELAKLREDKVWLQSQIAQASGEATAATTQASTPVADQPPKRGRGRPRKAEKATES